MKDSKPRVKGQGGVAKQTPRTPLSGGNSTGNPKKSKLTGPNNPPGFGAGGSTHNNLGTP